MILTLICSTAIFLTACSFDVVRAVLAASFYSLSAIRRHEAGVSLFRTAAKLWREKWSEIRELDKYFDDCKTAAPAPSLSHLQFQQPLSSPRLLQSSAEAHCGSQSQSKFDNVPDSATMTAASFSHPNHEKASDDL